VSKPKVVHEEPEVRLIRRSEVPDIRRLGNRVDRDFWLRLMNRVVVKP
jgi:hypothetical protein